MLGPGTGQASDFAGSMVETSLHFSSRIRLGGSAARHTHTHTHMFLLMFLLYPTHTLRSAYVYV